MLREGDRSGLEGPVMERVGSRPAPTGSSRCTNLRRQAGTADGFRGTIPMVLQQDPSRLTRRALPEAVPRPRPSSPGARQYAGSSRIASRSRRAKDDGSRCPNSQERTVANPAPRKSANPAWLKPSESRMARISAGDGVGISARTRRQCAQLPLAPAGCRTRPHRRRRGGRQPSRAPGETGRRPDSVLRPIRSRSGRNVPPCSSELPRLDQCLPHFSPRPRYSPI